MISNIQLNQNQTLSINQTSTTNISPSTDTPYYGSYSANFDSIPNKPEGYTPAPPASIYCNWAISNEVCAKVTSETTPTEAKVSSSSPSISKDQGGFEHREHTFEHEENATGGAQAPSVHYNDGIDGSRGGRSSNMFTKLR